MQTIHPHCVLSRRAVTKCLALVKAFTLFNVAIMFSQLINYSNLTIKMSLG